jgi:hypothetical protein
MDAIITVLLAAPITAFSEWVRSASTQQRLERLEPSPLCVV